MRLLFLGHSGTVGDVLERVEDAYPYLVLRALQEAWPKEAIEIDIRPLVPTPTAAEYAERVYRRMEPNVVILEIGGYQITPTVDARVRRVIPRLYPYYARLRDSLYRFLASPGRPSLTRGLYSALRRFLGTVLGSEAPAATEAVAESYCAVLRSLSALELAHLIVISTSFKHSRLERERPDLRANVTFLNDLIRSCAQRMGVTIVDRTGPFLGRDDLYHEDGIHHNLAGHRKLA